MNASTINHLETFAKNHPGWLFRGHRSIDWKLETSLEHAARRCGENQNEYERRILEEFQRHAHTYLTRTPKRDDTLEWLALMQHHGAPTRLIDFTWSPYVAAFFALEHALGDGVVWAMNPTRVESSRAARESVTPRTAPATSQPVTFDRRRQRMPVDIEVNVLLGHRQ